MPEVVRITKNDRARPLSATLRGPDGTPVDLTGNTVVFRMVEFDTPTNVTVNSVAATILSAADGTVEYSWAAGDVDAVGRFKGWFIRTITASGKVEHFPGDGDYIKVDIVEAY